MRDRRDHRRPVRKQADQAENPDHDRGHEFRLALGARQGSTRPRRDRDGNLDHHRRRRHDPRGTRAFKHPGLPGAALALRHESGRPAQGRCDRGGDRPGRQAGRRRNAAGAEDFPARRRDADAAGRHRSALGLPTSGLDGSGRPGDQAPRAAGNHRLGEADLRQGRCFAPLLRHRACGQSRRRRDRTRRHAGRHRGNPGSLHRARRHSDACGDSAGRAGAAGTRHAPQGAAHRIRRHPQRRGCRQVPCAGCRCGVDRHRGAYRDRRQRSALRRRVPQARHHGRRLRRLARGPRSGRHHHPGRGAVAPARSGDGRPQARQLPRGADAGNANHRPRLRQVARPQSGAGRPCRAHHRSCGNGKGPARGHRLDSGREEQAGRRRIDLPDSGPGRQGKGAMSWHHSARTQKKTGSNIF